MAHSQARATSSCVLSVSGCFGTCNETSVLKQPTIPSFSAGVTTFSGTPGESRNFTGCPRTSNRSFELGKSRWHNPNFGLISLDRSFYPDRFPSLRWPLGRKLAAFVQMEVSWRYMLPTACRSTFVFFFSRGLPFQQSNKGKPGKLAASGGVQRSTWTMGSSGSAGTGSGGFWALGASEIEKAMSVSVVFVGFWSRSCRFERFE